MPILPYLPFKPFIIPIHCLYKIIYLPLPYSALYIYILLTICHGTTPWHLAHDHLFPPHSTYSVQSDPGRIWQNIACSSRRHIAAHCRTLPAHRRSRQNMAEYGRRHAPAPSRVLCTIWHLLTQQPYNDIYPFSPVSYFLFLTQRLDFITQFMYIA